MVEEIAFENSRISNSEVLVTLTLDRVILRIVVHHSSTSTYMPDGRTFETGFVKSTLSKSRPNKQQNGTNSTFKSVKLSTV